jgi:hypothetical protein
VVRKAAPSHDVLLVLYAGSSSIKFTIYGVSVDGLDRLIDGEIEDIGTLRTKYPRCVELDQLAEIHEAGKVGDPRTRHSFGNTCCLSSPRLYVLSSTLADASRR